MTELIGTLNDTMEVLRNSLVCDVELGRHFSETGYKACTLYAVAKDNILYRAQTFIVDGYIHGSLSIYENFEVDQRLFEDPLTSLTTMTYDGKTFVPNKLHQEQFIKILQLDKEPDKVYSLSFKDDITKMDGIKDIIYNNVVNVYSPILTF